MRLVSLAVTSLLLAVPPAVSAARQEPVDLDAVTRLRDEGLNRSQVMETVWFLTDLHGPRLTNSPQQRRAAEWARGRLEEFGLSNARLESWGEFGLGWSFERCVVELVAPIYMPLVAFPKAWSTGLEAPLRATPVVVSAATAEEAEALRGTLAGKIVLNGKVREVGTPFEAPGERYDAETLAELVDAEGDDRGPGAPATPAVPADERRREREAQREVRKKLEALFREEGVALVIEPDAGRRSDYGVVFVGGGGSYDPAEPRALPQVVVAQEHFNRLVRLIEKGHAVELAADVRTSFHAEDTSAHNVVAEIPGRDPALSAEVVMLGAHFDSWHAGTGATDNGASCAVVMEAARLIVATGLEPRRTIRVALWTGEEQGLLGSKGYVERHFAERDTMELLPEHAQLSAYFNLDNGAGKIRGIYLQGNAAVGPIFSAWLQPFHDLGATTVTMRDTGSTDHIAFDSVGLPGFQFVQDALDYSTRSHHTNMDLYERVPPSDVQQAAVIMAAFAWHAAMRDEMLPRKPLPRPKEPE